MASSAMENEAAKLELEAEIRKLQDELAAVKKDFIARLDALEARVLPAPEEEHVYPEILAVIAVAVTSFLGKKVRIRSARPLSTIAPWAQAGRAIVQASHNLKR